MTRSTLTIFLAGLTAACLALPIAAAEQTTGANVSKKTGEAWDTIKAYTLDKKSEAVAYGRQLMQDTDAKIGQLEAKAATASGEAKAKYDKELQELKAARADTAAKLDKMEKEGGGAWNEAKRGFADAYRDLQRAYRKAVK